jgi:hypothetical protein
VRGGVGVDEVRSEVSWFAVVGDVGEKGDSDEDDEGNGDEGLRMEERRRVARLRTVTNRGRSVDDYPFLSMECSKDEGKNVRGCRWTERAGYARIRTL